MFWDDYLSVLAYLFLLAQGVVILFIMRHFDNLETSVANSISYDKSIVAILKLSFAINMLFASSVYAIKGSFMALMWRIVQNLSVFRKVWWAITISIGVMYVIALALDPITCARFDKGTSTSRFTT